MILRIQKILLRKCTTISFVICALLTYRSLLRDIFIGEIETFQAPIREASLITATPVHEKFI